jgi:glycosyl transferase family 87
MWFYVVRILIPYQVADAAARQRPRGNLSDLYPRWLGARELWLHGRNPYAADVTREIQAGYYGRPLDPQRPNDPGDQQGFAYPVYVTFLLIPTLRSPFELVRGAFSWFLLVFTGVSVLWWLRMLRWRPGWAITSAAVLLTLGSFPGLQGVRLQQLSLLVAALIAASSALLVGGHLFAAGVILAIATVKPQLVVLLAFFFLLWAVSGWQERQGFVWGFLFTLAGLCLGAQWLLPTWIADFWQALHEYQQYTGGHSRLDVLLGPVLGKLAAVAVLTGVGLLSFRFRRLPASDRTFQLVLVTVLTATLLVVPSFAPYNQLLLLPAILFVVREGGDAGRSKALRVAVVVAFLFLVWAWSAAFGLTVASAFLPAASIQREWAVPLWSEFAIAPSFLLVLALLFARVRPRGSGETALASNRG